jgi:hypothetical protein
MSTRLHVVLSDDESERYRACAEAAGVNLSTWVRTALRFAEQARPRRSPAEKLAALRRFMDTLPEDRAPMPPIDEYLAWHEATRYGDLPKP